jgi:hypothetical protein|tara:strand:- start:130 stop:444 length:315 start_codon:yes stop_codon:yes gene_type:complete
MIRSVTNDITAAASGETLVTFLSGIEGKSRRVTEIRVETTADMDVRAYLDQDRIVDVGSEAETNENHPIPVDVEVPLGKAFKAGWQNNTGGGLTAKIVVFYEET